ncbi:LysR family transcriptional regulator [Curvivirga aplysinae]|uniref:LysR family transcriptional regulator n=1 Tax=Curvivirga aplysinae TaxID=2529852 RepID=UPI0012BD5B04|nr:LysR family transcriptional regulator [Curvivirga aplysinae]MTI08193.1 LysR family transcriptional regulator [Curvivirga aplysinae]
MLPPIQNILAFVTIVELKQLKRAASHLNLTESAISHQLSRLEDQLGRKLLERGRNEASLTSDGEIFYAFATNALRELQNGVSAIQSHNVNSIHITAPRTMVAMWLAAKIPEFYIDQPNIELRLSATDRVCNLKHEKIHLAIRSTPNLTDGYRYEKFCEQYIFPVASPEIAKEIAIKGWDQVVKETAFILNETHQGEWKQWSEEFNISCPEEREMRRLGSYDIVQSACIKGLGIAMGRYPLCSEAIQDGRLVPIFEDKKFYDTPYYLAWSEDSPNYKSLRIVRDWLLERKPID